jgi:hypothetical protein
VPDWSNLLKHLLYYVYRAIYFDVKYFCVLRAECVGVFRIIFVTKMIMSENNINLFVFMMESDFVLS